MSLSPLPTVGATSRLAEVDETVEGARTTTPDSFHIHGTRTDLTTGRGVRYRHGILPSGRFGTEAFTIDGKRCRNGKWAGEIFWFAGSVAPEGCERANGGLVDGTTSDETYLYLWRATGTTHGGSSQSSFAKPTVADYGTLKAYVAL